MRNLFILIVTAFLLCSCGINHQIQTNGKTTVITTDTTVIYHGGNSHVTVKTPVR